MSLRLVGDGTLTSSKVFTTLTLNPGPTPDRVQDNAEVIEGDAGFSIQYEKGTYRKIFQIRIPLITSSVKAELERNFYNLISGRSNWFTLQPHQQSAIGDMPQQGSSSTTHLKHTDLALDTGRWRGHWAVIKTGIAQGLWRKIKDSWGLTTEVVVDPAFDYAVATGDIFMLGYPVQFMDNEILFIPRLPDWWECQMTLIEKVMG